MPPGNAVGLICNAPLTVRVPLALNVATPTASVDVDATVAGPASVTAAVPLTSWTPVVPLTFRVCPAGIVSAAPLTVRLPARFNAPVIVDVRVTPALVRSVPRIVAGVAPAAV